MFKVCWREGRPSGQGGRCKSLELHRRLHVYGDALPAQVGTTCQGHACGTVCACATTTATQLFHVTQRLKLHSWRGCLPSLLPCGPDRGHAKACVRGPGSRGHRRMDATQHAAADMPTSHITGCQHPARQLAACAQLASISTTLSVAPARVPPTTQHGTSHPACGHGCTGQHNPLQYHGSAPAVPVDHWCCSLAGC